MTSFLHAVATWLEFLSVAFCIGVLACRVFVFPPPAAGVREKRDFPERAWRLFGLALAIILAGSAVDLLIRTAGMSGQPISAVFPFLSTVLFKTHYGRVWIVRIAAVLLLSFLVWAGLRHRDSRIFLSSLLCIAVFIASTRSATGHAADAGDFSMAEIMDWLHIVAACVWGGGLFVLSVVILPDIIRPDNIPAPLLASIAGRFSRMAGAAVGILALSALYSAWLHVGSLKGLWLTPYGEIVIVKIVLFFFLINLGAFNRYVSVPLLQQLGGVDPGKRGMIGSLAARVMSRLERSHDERGASLRFMRSVKAEAILVVIVLFCAALLVQQVPARHALHTMSGEGHSHGMRNQR